MGIRAELSFMRRAARTGLQSLSRRDKPEKKPRRAFTRPERDKHAALRAEVAKGLYPQFAGSRLTPGRISQILNDKSNIKPDFTRRQKVRLALKWAGQTEDLLRAELFLRAPKERQDTQKGWKDLLEE